MSSSGRLLFCSSALYFNARCVKSNVPQEHSFNSEPGLATRVLTMDRFFSLALIANGYA